MEIAFLFPGQGAKRVDVALRSTVRPAAGRALCELAAAEAGVALAKVLERPSLLDRTEVLQPMLTAIALAASEALAAAGVLPTVVLGHSLGELAAWSASGAVPAAEAVRLAAVRGRLMARAAAAKPGGMVALGTADAGVIEEALAVGRCSGEICVAAYNAPDETVLSGDEVAVRAVMAFAPALATRVPTAGAWHSPAMLGAVDEWRSALHAAKLGDVLGVDFVANAHGDVVSCSADIPDLLAEQLVRPVQWARALATATRPVMVTLGPGAVLRSLWHRNQGMPRAGESAAGGAGSPHAGGLTASRPKSSPFATDDERALAETIAALRAVQ